MDFLLPIWNPFIVHPMENGLRLIAQPLAGLVSPGVAGALAITIFTIVLRLVLLPRLVPAYDLVFIARPASASADWPQLRQAVEDALARAGVLRCVACTPASCSGAPQE